MQLSKIQTLSPLLQSSFLGASKLYQTSQRSPPLSPRIQQGVGKLQKFDMWEVRQPKCNLGPAFIPGLAPSSSSNYLRMQQLGEIKSPTNKQIVKVAEKEPVLSKYYEDIFNKHWNTSKRVIRELHEAEEITLQSLCIHLIDVDNQTDTCYFIPFAFLPFYLHLPTWDLMQALMNCFKVKGEEIVFEFDRSICDVEVHKKSYTREIRCIWMKMIETNKMFCLTIEYWFLLIVDHLRLSVRIL